MVLTLQIWQVFVVPDKKRPHSQGGVAGLNLCALKGGESKGSRVLYVIDSMPWENCDRWGSKKSKIDRCELLFVYKRRTPKRCETKYDVLPSLAVFSHGWSLLLNQPARLLFIQVKVWSPALNAWCLTCGAVTKSLKNRLRRGWLISTCAGRHSYGGAMTTYLRNVYCFLNGDQGHNQVNEYRSRQNELCIPGSVQSHPTLAFF